MEITDDAIRDVVLGAMRNANEARDAASQLVVSAEAPIFGPDSPLDSLGLVGAAARHRGRAAGDRAATSS